MIRSTPLCGPVPSLYVVRGESSGLHDPEREQRRLPGDDPLRGPELGEVVGAGRADRDRGARRRAPAAGEQQHGDRGEREHKCAAEHGDLLGSRTVETMRAAAPLRGGRRRRVGPRADADRQRAALPAARERAARAVVSPCRPLPLRQAPRVHLELFANRRVVDRPGRDRPRAGRGCGSAGSSRPAAAGRFGRSIRAASSATSRARDSASSSRSGASRSGSSGSPPSEGRSRCTSTAGGVSAICAGCVCATVTRSCSRSAATCLRIGAFAFRPSLIAGPVSRAGGRRRPQARRSRPRARRRPRAA